MGRPQTSLDAQKLLIEGPGGVGGNLRTICPPCLAICLDGLSGHLRVAREEVCQDKRRSKSKNQKSAWHIVGSPKKRKKRTIHNILDLVEAGGQHRLSVSPGGVLALELGQESGLPLLGLVQRLLEQLLLLGQLHRQQVAFRGELATLLIGTPGGIGLAQLLLKSGTGS